MNNTELAKESTHNRLLEEVEKFLLNASPEDIKKVLENMDEKDRINAAVDRMQKGIARLREVRTSSPYPSFAMAAFAGVQNTPAQNARIRIAFAIALNPQLSDEVHYTPQNIFDLGDSEAISLYESLKSDGKIP